MKNEIQIDEKNANKEHVEEPNAYLDIIEQENILPVDDMKSMTILSHQQSTKSQLDCGQCNYATTNKGHLSRHVMSVHNKIKEFECETCGQSFGRKDNLERHLKNKHGILSR